MTRANRDISVTWVLLTFNRKKTVEECFQHNASVSGEEWNELVWCDNGSSDGTNKIPLPAHVKIRNVENLGVAKGYNRAMALASKDYIVITGCDMKMPHGWLKTFKDYIRAIPETGIACIYSQPLDKVPERIRGQEQIVNGLPIVPAMPIGRRILSRKMLHDVGYFHEGFGLYGWDDVVWGYRAEKVCKEQGKLSYVIPRQIAQHFGTEGVQMFDGKDHVDYHAFKQREVNERYKAKLMSDLRERGYPRFNPYSGEE